MTAKEPPDKRRRDAERRARKSNADRQARWRERRDQYIARLERRIVELEGEAALAQLRSSEPLRNRSPRRRREKGQSVT
jgi:hypothetical protein